MDLRRFSECEEFDYAVYAFYHHDFNKKKFNENVKKLTTLMRKCFKDFKGERFEDWVVVEPENRKNPTQVHNEKLLKNKVGEIGVFLTFLQLLDFPHRLIEIYIEGVFHSEPENFVYISERESHCYLRKLFGYAYTNALIRPDEVVLVNSSYISSLISTTLVKLKGDEYQGMFREMSNDSCSLEDFEAWIAILNDFQNTLH